MGSGAASSRASRSDSSYTTMARTCIWQMLHQISITEDPANLPVFMSVTVQMLLSSQGSALTLRLAYIQAITISAHAKGRGWGWGGGGGERQTDRLMVLPPDKHAMRRPPRELTWSTIPGWVLQGRHWRRELVPGL